MAAALERAHELLSTLPPEQLQESGVVLAELEAAIAGLTTPPSPPSQPLAAGGAATVDAVARAATSLLPIAHGASSAPPPPPPPPSPALSWEQEFAATEAARAVHPKSGEHFLCGLQRGDWVDVNIGGLCCQLVAAAAPALPLEAAGTQPQPPPPPPPPQAAQEERWVVAQVVSVALDVPTPLGHLMRDCTLLVPDAGHQRRRGMGRYLQFRCARCNMLGPSRESGPTACVHCRLCSVCCELLGARGGQRCDGGKERRADLCADRDSSGRDPQSPEPESERELEPEPELEPEAGLMAEGVPMQPRAARVMLNIGKAHRGEVSQARDHAMAVLLPDQTPRNAELGEWRQRRHQSSQERAITEQWTEGLEQLVSDDFLYGDDDEDDGADDDAWSGRRPLRRGCCVPFVDDLIGSIRPVGSVTGESPSHAGIAIGESVEVRLVFRPQPCDDALDAAAELPEELRAKLEQGRMDRAHWVRASVAQRSQWLSGSRLLGLEAEDDDLVMSESECAQIASQIAPLTWAGRWAWRAVTATQNVPPCWGADVALLSSVDTDGSALPSPLAWVSTDCCTPLRTRMDACGFTDKAQPQRLVGRRVLLGPSPSSIAMRSFAVTGWCPEVGLHVVTKCCDPEERSPEWDYDGSSDEEGETTRNSAGSRLQLLDLRQNPFLVEPSPLPISQLTSLASLGTHCFECAICLTSKPKTACKPFCYARYHVDGHEIDIGEPRHPLTVCDACLCRHITVALTQGKISVRCPVEGCGRALQTRELKDHVDGKLYTKLLESLRAAEEEHDVAEIAAALDSASMELRHCPRCRVLIEKNHGCSSMRCYRCDHSFTWSNAALPGGQSGNDAGAATADHHRARQLFELPLGGWGNILDWDRDGLRGHHLSGAPLAVARRVAAAQALVDEYRDSQGNVPYAYAVGITIPGLLLIYQAGGSLLLTLALVECARIIASKSAQFIRRVSNGQLLGALNRGSRMLGNAAGWNPMHLHLVVSGRVALAGTAIAVHFYLTSLVWGCLASLIWGLKQVFMILVRVLFFVVVHFLPAVVRHWTRAIFVIEAAGCSLMAVGWFCCWTAKCVKLWRRDAWLTNTFPERVLQLLLHSWRYDNDPWSNVLCTIGGVVLCLKCGLLFSAVGDRCYEITSSATYVANCTWASSECGFSCVGENCAMTSSQFRAIHSAAFGWSALPDGANQTNLSTWTTQCNPPMHFLWPACASLAPPGYIVDATTGTCVGKPIPSSIGYGFVSAWVAAILVGCIVS
jgi:hypothetical protein